MESTSGTSSATKSASVPKRRRTISVVIDPYHPEGAARRQQVAGVQSLAHGGLAFKVRGGEPRLLLRGRHS